MALVAMESFALYGEPADMEITGSGWEVIRPEVWELLPTGGPEGQPCARITTDDGYTTHTLGTTYSHYGGLLRTVTAYATYTVGFMLMFEALHDTVTAYQTSILTFRGASVGNNHAQIGIDGYGNLILMRNDGTEVDRFGPVELNQWYHVEMQVYVDAAGTIELRIDGTLAGYETGVDTADSTSTTDYILFGGDQYNSDYRPAGLIYNISDFYVMDDTGTYCNDFLGNGTRVDFVLPTADGATTQFTPSAGAVNYAMIDEAWHDYDDTRNVNGTVGNKDTFEVDDLSEITKGEIHAIKPLMIAKKSDATARTCNLVQRQNSVEGDSTAVTLTETFDYHSGVFYTNPDTAAQWTKTEFTSSEFGYKNAS